MFSGEITIRATFSCAQTSFGSFPLVAAADLSITRYLIEFIQLKIIERYKVGRTRARLASFIVIIYVNICFYL